MTAATYPRLLGDIGGTNARFAWQAAPASPLIDVRSYACEAHPTLQSAMAQYLKECERPAPKSCGIGIANPVTGDLVQMTNHHWQFSIRSMRAEMGFDRLVVINDFAALALSLPALSPAEWVQIGRGNAQAGAPMAVIGPGTGLGVSGLLRVGGADTPLRGEGGHVTLAATSDLEAAVIEQLRLRFGHASAERALSGPGLVNLYTALCQLYGEPAKSLGPADIVNAARQNTVPRCAETLALFFNFLGSAAGNLALTLGAHGGVFIGGGIVARLIPELMRSSFREKFEGKGRLQPYLQNIPTMALTAQVSPALLGASRALDGSAATMH